MSFGVVGSITVPKEQMIDPTTGYCAAPLHTKKDLSLRRSMKQLFTKPSKGTSKTIDKATQTTDDISEALQVEATDTREPSEDKLVENIGIAVYYDDGMRRKTSDYFITRNSTSAEMKKSLRAHPLEDNGVLHYLDSALRTQMGDRVVVDASPQITAHNRTSLDENANNHYESDNQDTTNVKRDHNVRVGGTNDGVVREAGGYCHRKSSVRSNNSSGPSFVHNQKAEFLNHLHGSSSSGVLERDAFTANSLSEQLSAVSIVQGSSTMFPPRSSSLRDTHTSGSATTKMTRDTSTTSVSAPYDAASATIEASAADDGASFISSRSATTIPDSSTKISAAINSSVKDLREYYLNAPSGMPRISGKQFLAEIARRKAGLAPSGFDARDDKTAGSAGEGAAKSAEESLVAK